MRLTILLFFIYFNISAQQTYQKSYFENGKMKAEGWQTNNQKTGYWKFYFDNGNLKKEGHFSENKEAEYWRFYDESGTKKSEGHFTKGSKCKWWIFYNNQGEIFNKCQYLNNKKNGYSLLYRKGEIISASKYKANKKVKEWTNYKSFRQENNLRDLK